MESKKRLKTYLKLRSENNNEIIQMKQIARDLNIYESEHLIVWFKNRFEDHDLGYFDEWSRRYLKGTQYFISRMDLQSRQIFKKVFLK